ncbi:hypothetical protein Tco_1309954 [Tanacetum coccineum]
MREKEQSKTTDEAGTKSLYYKAILRPTSLPDYPSQDFTMSTSSLQAEKTVYIAYDTQYLKLYNSRYDRGEGLSIFRRTGMLLGPKLYALDHNSIDIMRGGMHCWLMCSSFILGTWVGGEGACTRYDFPNVEILAMNDKKGETALHMAVKGQNYEAFLAEGGADASIGYNLIPKVLLGSSQWMQCQHFYFLRMEKWYTILWALIKKCLPRSVTKHDAIAVTMKRLLDFSATIHERATFFKPMTRWRKQLGCPATAACSLPLPNRNMPKKEKKKKVVAQVINLQVIVASDELFIGFHIHVVKLRC